MKLSDAIRLGSMIRGQNRGGYLQDNKTCALGAALDAVGVFAVGQIQCSSLPIEEVFEHFPVVRLQVDNPVIEKRSDVGSVIFYLNDTLAWTRPRIADWVEEIENEIEAATKATTEELVEVGV